MTKRRPLLTPILYILLTLLLLAPFGRAVASVDLLYFRSESTSNTIKLVWATGFELNNLGFFVLRADDGDMDNAVRINPSIIPGTNNVNGATYEYVDTTPQAGAVYYYWLESIDSSEGSSFEGPILASVSGGTALNTPTPGAATETPLPASPTPSPTTPAASPTTIPPTATVLPVVASRTPGPSPTPLPASPTPTSPPASPTAVSTVAILPTTPPDDTPEPDPIGLPTLTPVPDIAAEELLEDAPPLAPAESSAVAEPSPTAEQAIAAIGQGTDDNDEGGGLDALPPPMETAPESGGGNLTFIVLLVGLLLSIGGGVATWLFLRRGTQA